MKTLEDAICDEKACESNQANGAEDVRFLKTEIINKRHRIHFLFLILFSIGATVAYLILALQKQELYFSECPNCIVSYFSDLYVFVLANLGIVLVGLINYQTKLCTNGEPPIVFFNHQPNGSMLLIAEIIYAFTAVVLQGYFCTSLLSLHARNLLLMKITTFYVHFFIGFVYYKKVYLIAMEKNVLKNATNAAKRIDIVQMKNGEKETKSDIGFKEENSGKMKDTLNLDYSDKSSISKFSEIDFKQGEVESTISADVVKIRNKVMKVAKKGKFQLF